MISRELWLANLVNDARALADKQHQEKRWSAPDAKPWENPGELLCAVFDDHLLNEFIAEHSPSFSAQQLEAATTFKSALVRHRALSPKKLIAEDVLVDPEWQLVRHAAARFVAVFDEQ